MGNARQAFMEKQQEGTGKYHPRGISHFYPARALKRLQLCGNRTLHLREANALRLMTQ